FEPEEWLRTRSTPTTLHGTAHHIGTTRMADSPRRGVVDRHCRVHGIDNLHIAGSSVFPTGGWVFPTLTIAALSLRLADRLAARLADERGSMWLGATTSATEPSRLHARELAALPGASRGRGIVHVADRDGTRAGT
ncbi:MAG: GMC family oxidoreductase, partial [Vicinamibacterales bacterium]